MIPPELRRQVKKRAWSAADRVQWFTIPAPRKSMYYEKWSRDPEIGGLLAGHLDLRRIRVYLKDTVLKSYVRERMADDDLPMRAAAIPAQEREYVEAYIKPHGRRLQDGRIICWAAADQWRDLLLSLHERSFDIKGARPYAAVLLRAHARFAQRRPREMVESAAKKLGIEKTLWLEEAVGA